MRSQLNIEMIEEKLMIFLQGETLYIETHRGSVQLERSSERGSLFLSRHNGCASFIRIRADILRSLWSRGLFLSITVPLNPLFHPCN